MQAGGATMTEDEAFIRAVVDGPGDDTPRLVYADWLDDRADPRGTYLRAEAEWAKPWRSGERPADSPELRELARGLDPVWVARVSRPPLGVCCDHVRFERTGDSKPVTEKDVAEFDLGYLFLDLRPSSRGVVYHFPDYCHQADDARWLIRVADTLSTFFGLVGRSAEFGAVHEGFVDPRIPNS